ncbi:helix-turn-helix transcriptional regulator [Raoultibacter timonensis]|uniref:helix-turn-helix transcriptional regulator n=1 Tax=Raoultibacter timonensis TaxID=1907662 RepID=UPI000C843116|nr:helix-turn-helix transcriptional regulator [Raoultibacter timonensis]
MRQELEPIVDGASTDLFSAPAEPSTTPGGEFRDAVGPARYHGLGVARKICIACSFTVTLLLPALSIATLVTVKPILPASAQPVGALTFVLVFAYLMACLFAIGEITARPLTPRSRTRKPRVSVFAGGVLLAIAAPVAVIAAAPHVSQTLLAKGLVCFQAALCAGGFAACLITSVRLYRVSVERAAKTERHANLTASYESNAAPHAASRPAFFVRKIQNGFDRSTARSLVGIGLVSCATGIAAMSLFAPAWPTHVALCVIGLAALAVSAFLSVLIVRADRWTRIALAQWIGLLIGLNIGYFTLLGGLVGRHPETIVSGCALAMLVCGIPCLLAHPSEKEVSLPTLFPLPEPIVSAEEFCAEAAEAFGLTPREGETLLLVLENYDAHDIADEFGISPKTAKSYIRKVCRKVGSTDVEGLVDVLDAWDAERENEAESTR